MSDNISNKAIVNGYGYLSLLLGPLVAFFPDTFSDM